MNNKQKLISSTMFLSFTILISKFLGLIREMLIAKYFGATAQVDAYVIATRIPSFISTIITIGIGVSVVAVFSEYLANNKEEEGWDFLKILLKYLFPFLIIITIFVIIFAPFIIKITAPGFDFPTFKLAVFLVRITAFYFLFQEMGGLMQAILQSCQKYKQIIIWQLIPNIIILTALVFLAKIFGIVVLAIAFTITGVFYFGIMFPGVKGLYKNKNYVNKIKNVSPLQNEGIKKFFKMVFPIALVASSSQIVFLVENMLASYLKSGSIAIFKYAYLIYLMPIQIISSTLIFILYPVLANYYGAKDLEKFKETIFSGIRIISFVLLPITVSFIILSLPLTRVLYERGALIPEDTYRISQVLKYFAPGIITYVLTDFFSKVFFAMQNTKTPMKTGFVGVFFNIIWSLILVRFFQLKGLALATALTACLNLFLLYFFLKKYLDFKLPKSFFKFIFSIILAVSLSSFLLYTLMPFFETKFFLATLEKRILALIIMQGLFMFVYFLTAYILKVEEEKILWANFILKIWQRFARIFE